MKKVCAFITGTNAVGKTTLIKALAERHGGFVASDNDLTPCEDGLVCLAGCYDRFKFGGVDRIRNAQGHSCTSRLAEVVEAGLASHDIIICEGMFLHTFGLNLSNALFKGERQLVVYLYADATVLHQRLLNRSGSRVTEIILKKQRNCCAAANKWQSIGVPVLSFNTGQCDFEAMVDEVDKKIMSLWNE